MAAGYDARPLLVSLIEPLFSVRRTLKNFGPFLSKSDYFEIPATGWFLKVFSFRAIVVFLILFLTSFWYTFTYSTRPRPSLYSADTTCCIVISALLTCCFLMCSSCTSPALESSLVVTPLLVAPVPSPAQNSCWMGVKIAPQVLSSTHKATKMPLTKRVTTKWQPPHSMS